MEGLARAMDQIVYVPVYSHIYHSQGAPLSLTATLSIRNTDLEASIIVTAVDYFDSAGKLVRKYMDAPLILPALSSLEYVVGEQENTGGAGANFIVEWFAQTEVFEPIIESVMIGTKSQQGISFISVGKVVSKK
jgi:bifunctional ADP-heptose synthase (sugar kinase/adenylyltransferase)